MILREYLILDQRIPFRNEPSACLQCGPTRVHVSGKLTINLYSPAVKRNVLRYKAFVTCIHEQKALQSEISCQMGGFGKGEVGRYFLKQERMAKAGF